jgi:hypothetical protein
VKETDEYIYCEGCGDRVVTPRPRQFRREHREDPSPGRVSIMYGGLVVHQCAEGTYLPPDQIAAEDPD